VTIVVRYKGHNGNDYITCDDGVVIDL